MKLKAAGVIPLFALFLNSAIAVPRVLPPDRVRAGDGFAIYIVEMASQQGVRVELNDPSGTTIAQGISFPVQSISSVFAVLIGVPNWALAGDYSIAVFGERAVEPFFESVITIYGRSFIQETITLSGSMSGLRQSEDQRKIRESNELWNLLTTVNPDAQYHLGSFCYPLADGTQTSFFGDRREFKYADGTASNSIHTGIDIAAPLGTPILSSGFGRIAFAAERMLTGNTIVIEHLPGLYSLYYHMDTLLVDEDRLIKKGELLGTLGATGLVTGAHLHWEFRVNGVPVDPEFIIGFAPLDKATVLGQIPAQ